MIAPIVLALLLIVPQAAAFVWYFRRLRRIGGAR